MSTVHIPLALLDAAEYQALPWGCREFLIGLYVVHFDCDRFTIDLKRPEAYRQLPGVWLQRKIAQLQKAGLLVQDGVHLVRGKGYCTKKRVFRFKYPAFELTKEAA